MHPTLQYVSTIFCPRCGARQSERMAEADLVEAYDCRACGATLRPRPGDCCVFCAYGTVPCPSVQKSRVAG